MKSYSFMSRSVSVLSCWEVPPAIYHVMRLAGSDYLSRGGLIAILSLKWMGTLVHQSTAAEPLGNASSG